MTPIDYLILGFGLIVFRTQLSRSLILLYIWMKRAKQ